MNIFLPYENDIGASVRSLDDVRLNKQIEECKTILNAILEHKKSGLKLGYFHHLLFIKLWHLPVCPLWRSAFCIVVVPLVDKFLLEESRHIVGGANMVGVFN